MAALSGASLLATGGVADAASPLRDLSSDIAPIPQPPTPAESFTSQAAAVGAGFRTFDLGSGYVAKANSSYTIRLVSGNEGNVESLRSAVVAAAAQLTAESGITFAIPSGTVSNTSPDREPVNGEILIGVDGSTPCGAGAAGCGGPRQINWDSANGVGLVAGGRVWIYPVVLGYSSVNLGHVVAHELGHAIGLDHFNDAWDGSYQVMHASSYSAGNTYKTGDRNGFRYLRGICEGLPATHIGTNGVDNMTGTAGRDVMVGFAGDDTINGAGGDDVICGGPGGDTISGMEGNDRIFGEGGNDPLLNGNMGNDLVDGGPGNDTVRGGADNDQVRGGPGGDTVYGDLGSDTVLGDDDSDTLYGGNGAGNDNASDVLNGGNASDTCIYNTADQLVSCETSRLG